MHAWRGQFNRVLRRLNRLEQVGTVERSAIDDLASFFQDCWHLKDWIRNDDSLPQFIRSAIIQEAENTESLQFCADLANRLKHLKLNHERKGAGLCYIEAVTTSHAITGNRISSVPIGYAIASKHGTPAPFEIIGFAKRAVNDWIALLNKHGLSTS